MFTVKVVQRSLPSVAHPQPDENIHENYWVKVYEGNNLITQVRSVHVSYAADLYDDPEVSFPDQIVLEHGADADTDIEAVKEAITTELSEQTRRKLDPDTPYTPPIIAEDL